VKSDTRALEAPDPARENNDAWPVVLGSLLIAF
jgi:hypothetical protein